MDPDGTNRHLLFSEGPAYGDGQANWSPDGSRVIFRRCNNAKEECSIYTIKPDGHGLTQITQPSQNAKGNNADVKPEFSPDGKTISFSSFNRGGVQNGIYLMGAHGLEAVTAFDVLRKRARDSRRRVADVAAEVIDRAPGSRAGPDPAGD